MNDQQKDAVLLWSIVLAGFSTVVYLGSSATRSCTFGKYTGEVTFRTVETQEPLADANVRTYIAFDGNPMIGNRTPYRTKTDAEGQAEVEFAKPFGMPLAVLVSSKPSGTAEPRGTAINFYIDSEDISSQATISRSKTERIIGGGQGDNISLTLRVNRWSLF